MTHSRLKEIVQTTLRQLDFERGVLLVRDEHSGQFRPVIALGYALSRIESSAWQPDLKKLDQGDVALRPAPWLPKPMAPGYAIPLKEDGLHVGVLLLLCEESQQEGELPRDNVAAICEKLSLAVYTSLLKRQSERRLRQLQLIAKVNQRITMLLADDIELDTVAQIVRDAFDFYNVSILLFDPRSRQLLRHFAAGAAADALTPQDMNFLEEGKGLVSWVMRTGEPVLVNDVVQEERYQRVSVLPHTRAEAVAPIKLNGVTTGVFDVQSDRRDAFDFVDLLVLQIVANQVADALDNNRLLRQERSRRELIQTLQETVRVISSSLELDRVLDLILRELGRVVSYDNVRLKRVEEDVAQVIAARGFKDLKQVMGTTYRVSENTLASLIVYERQTVNIFDIKEDPRWLWLPGTERIRSWVGVPLVMKDKVIGLLSVSRLQLQPFSEDEAEMVSSFANQAAIAIENARLYNELKEFSVRLEERVRERTLALEEARQELASVLSREVEVQENERIRIANELHDSIIQAMVAVIYQIQGIKQGLTAGERSSPEQLTEVQQMLEMLVAEIKAIVHDLRPPALESLGLIHAIRQLAMQFDEPPHFSTRLQVLGNVRSLSSGAERTVYRVVQEALSNARTHSDASHFKLALLFEKDQLNVIMQDNGSGFDPARVSGQGLGLLTMHDRARSSGGNLNIESAPEQGTRVELTLPIWSERGASQA